MEWGLEPKTFAVCRPDDPPGQDRRLLLPRDRDLDLTRLENLDFPNAWVRQFGKKHHALR
jgi:hypothetical protein